MVPDDVIALAEETVEIQKRTVETGQVKVSTYVDTEDLVLRDALQRGIVEVERVAIGREVVVAPVVREEGELLIVPVLEERLVVTKQLILVEELRIRRSTAAVPIEVPVTRRVMRAVIERDTPVAPTPEEASI